MEDIVRQLYPEHVDTVLREVSKLIEHYHFAGETSKKEGLTQKDSILITYGDSFYEKGRHPLATLGKFASEYLTGKINTVHLLPCFPFTSDDGFSVTDYYQINPELGNWNDISDLNENFDLMFDAVVNHISQESAWFQAFLEGQEPYEGYFIEADPKGDYGAVVRPRALPLLHAYQKQEQEVYVWTTFSRDQVDLNYANYRVFLQILDVLLFYVSKGARFIRLDAIAFLWKEIGTSCIHLNETHLVIQAYRKVLDSLDKKIYLITETNVPHTENISYFGNGRNEAHMVYNFTLPPLLALGIHKQDPKDLVVWANSLSLPGDGVCFFNFTASHDGVGVRPLQGLVSQSEIENLANKAIAHGGFVSYKDNGDGTKSPYELNCNYMDLLTHPEASQKTRVQRFLMSQSVMLCMPGVPGIYYHSLLGSENDREAALSSGINRRINREKLNFNKLETALKISEGNRNKIFEQYSRMLEVRATEHLFHPFGKAKYHQEGSVFLIERLTKNEVLYAIHNFSEEEMSIKSYVSTAKDLLTGEETSETRWKLPPFAFKWFKKV